MSEDKLRSVLRRELDELRKGRAVVVVEFGEDTVTVWRAQRDGNGTPYARHWPLLPDHSAEDPEDLYYHRLRPLADGSRLIVVFTTPSLPTGKLFGIVTAAHPDAPLHQCWSPLDRILREVITQTPLTHWYELVVLRRTRSGRLVFESRRLFPREADYRYPPQQVPIWCGPSDEHGIVFAVVAQLDGNYSLVSVQSAALEPGPYEPTARLLRPGHVAFEGLPVELRAERRSWPTIVGAVPPSFDRPQTAHLVCAIEVSGTKDQLDRRIDRVRQLITHADAADRELSVSLVSYGAHSFKRTVSEEPPTALAWADSARTALSELTRLGRRTPPDGEYPRAAQLECALTAIADRIDPGEGRPCLVTVGSRLPYPPRLDPRTEILPCPLRRDWQRALQQLSDISDITFGVIDDDTAADWPIWTRLGRDARESGDLVDVRRLALNLKLSRTVTRVPLPLIDVDGG